MEQLTELSIEDFNRESEEWTEIMFKQYEYILPDMVEDFVKPNPVEDTNGNII